MAPICTNVRQAFKDPAVCDTLLEGLCDQAEMCGEFDDLMDQLDALRQQAADLRVRACLHLGSFRFCKRWESSFDVYVVIHLPLPDAHAQALLPTATRYEGANGGDINVGGGSVANTLVQTTAFPSATSAAPRGIVMVRALLECFRSGLDWCTELS